MNDNFFDDKLNKIELLEKSDSSLDNYLDEIEKSNEYLDINNDLKNNIFNNLLDICEKEKYLEMNKIVNDTKHEKGFAHAIFKFGKIVVATCIAVSMTLFVTNGNIKFDRPLSNNKVRENFYNAFDNAQDFMTMSIHEKIEDIKNENK